MFQRMFSISKHNYVRTYEGGRKVPLMAGSHKRSSSKCLQGGVVGADEVVRLHF